MSRVRKILRKMVFLDKGGGEDVDGGARGMDNGIIST